MWLCKKSTTLNGLCYTVMQIGIFKKRLNYKNNLIYSNVISFPTSSPPAAPASALLPLSYFSKHETGFS